MSDAVVHPWVRIGSNPMIDPFCIIGYYPGDKGRVTSIGDGCVIRSHTVIYAGTTIGDGFQTGHGVTVREGCAIGDRVSIGTKSVLERDVTVASEVRVHSNAFLPEYTVLETGCWIGPNVVFTNARYPLCRNAKETLTGVIVEPSAIVGANTTVLPGIRIGKGALVGAGSTVTHDVPPGVVVAGSPAVELGQVEDIDAYRGVLW